MVDNIGVLEKAAFSGTTEGHGTRSSVSSLTRLFPCLSKYAPIDSEEVWAWLLLVPGSFVSKIPDSRAFAMQC
jgi:hypothetical protein